MLNYSNIINARYIKVKLKGYEIIYMFVPWKSSIQAVGRDILFCYFWGYIFVPLRCQRVSKNDKDKRYKP